MPDQPRISLILEDLKAAWETIAVANGDHTTVKTVLRKSEPPTSATNLPYISIEEVVEIKSGRVQQMRDVEVTVQVLLVMENKHADPENDIMRFAMDAEIKAETDFQRGGLALLTFLTEQEFLQILEEDEIILCRQQYRIRYMHAWRDPSAAS